MNKAYIKPEFELIKTQASTQFLSVSTDIDDIKGWEADENFNNIGDGYASSDEDGFYI